MASLAVIGGIAIGGWWWGYLPSRAPVVDEPVDSAAIEASQGKLPSLDASEFYQGVIAEEFEASDRRIKSALARRDLAATDPVATGADSRNGQAAGVASADQSPPRDVGGAGGGAPVEGVTPIPAEVLAWVEEQVAREHLGVATATRDEQLLRSSAAAYREEAQLQVGVEFVRNLCSRLGLPPEIPPENLYELLPRPALEMLKGRWAAHRAAMARADASDTSGAFARDLRDIDARISSIESALSRPHVDLAAYFVRNAGRVRYADDLARWLESERAGMAARAQQKERELLQIALARDEGNHAARVRLSELESGPAPDTAGVVEARRQLVMDRAEGLRPIPDRSREVGELIRDRFTDPIGAAKAEAVLREHWLELKEAAIFAEKLDVVLPGRLAQSFPDWLVSHLSLDDLTRVRGYLLEADALIEKAGATGQGDLPEWSMRLDRHLVRAELDAIHRELVDRHRGDGGPWAHRYRLADLPPGLSDLLRSQASTPRDVVLDSPGGLQSYWASLRLLGERSGPYLEAEIGREMAHLTLRAVAQPVEDLARDAEQLAELRSRYWGVDQEFIEPGEKAARKQADARARATLLRRAERIREGLAGIALLLPESDALRSRLNAVVRSIHDDQGPGGREAEGQDVPPFRLSSATASTGHDGWPPFEPPGESPPLTGEGPGGRPRPPFSPFGDPILLAEARNFSEAARQSAEIISNIEGSFKSRLARRVAELAFEVYPDGLPHEDEDARRLPKESRVERWSDAFKSIYPTETLRLLRSSLSSVASSKLNTAYGGHYTESLEAQYDGARVRYRGTDDLGREVYDINGVTKVINHHADGTTSICPAYIMD
jgi:hypothetical protein